MFVLDTRSLIEIRGSLLVILPISWVRHNALTKGQKVSVALDDSGQLVITPITTEKHNGIPAAGVDNSTKTLNSNFIAVPEAILFEIEETQHKKHWQTKLLTRLCGMTRTACVALSRVALLWVLRKLPDWL